MEQAGDHVLDLLLFGPAIADDGGFDGERRVFGDLQPGAGGGEHGYATNLSELEGGLYVQRIEDVFDGYFMGLVFGDDGAELRVDSREAAGQRFSRGKLDGTAGQTAEFTASVHLDDAVTGVFSAAVDAEDAHCTAVYRGKAWKKQVGAGGLDGC